MNKRGKAEESEFTKDDSGMREEEDDFLDEMDLDED